ncbi:MAG: hypothetical protein HFJ11_04770 [Bacilli bacterium]|nr:hypothetical protein [Bacilli bacterium]
MNENFNRLEDIKIENNIWLLYLVIIGISFIANEYEKKYFLYNDQKAKEIYRILTIIIFATVTIVYLYFAKDGYDNVKNLKPWDDKRKVNLTKLNSLASNLILIAGLIFLYIAIVDTELDVEIAFN